MVRWPNVLNKSLFAFQVACVAWDVGFGVYDLMYGMYVFAAWSFLAAGVLVVFMVMMQRQRKKWAAARVAMEQHHAMLRRTVEGRTMGPDAVLKAKANLQRVIQQTGAEWVQHHQFGQRIRMKVGEYVFFLNGHYIANQNGSETCYQVAAPMPEDEKVATAMLLLRNNPKLWDLWWRHTREWYV